MRFASTLFLTSSLCLVAPFASAQQAQRPAPTSVPQAASSPAPVPQDAAAASQAATAPVAQAVTATPRTAGAVCIVGSHAGVADDVAQASARIVCDEIRKLGIAISDPTSGVSAADDAYRVDVDAVGGAGMLRLAHEHPLGVPVATRRATVGSLDEVIIAAPRIATALVRDQPLEDTASVSTLVGGETRRYEKKHSETHFGVGILGMTTLGSSTPFSPGFELSLFHELPRYAVGGTLRGAGKSSNGSGKENGYGAVSLGGRYFFDESDISPYVGGGLAFITSLSVGDGSFHGQENGLAAYGEVGVEMMRYTRHRFGLSARVDAPFFSPTSRTYTDASYVSSKTESRYVVPVSLNASLSF